MSPTQPIDVASTPVNTAPIPETLGVLLGAIEIRRQFLRQAYTDSEEYWTCQRGLAVLERRWAEAERVWAQHVEQEDKR